MRYLLLCLLLAGCSGLVQVADVQTSTITWIKVDPTTCGGKPGTGGCAIWSDDRPLRPLETGKPLATISNTCTIIAEWDARDMMLAEEMRHCFGGVHRTGPK